MTIDREEALARIAENIRTHGFHMTAVASGPLPKWVYTVGLRETVGYDLVYAGGAKLSVNGAASIVSAAAAAVTADPGTDRLVAAGSRLVLHEVDPSWSSALMLAALDFYDTDRVEARQVVEFQDRAPDTPDMSRPWNPDEQPIWRWLGPEPWPYDAVAAETKTVTNIQALEGQPVTEASHFEEGDWQLIAGLGWEGDQDDLLEVPIGSLLGLDPSLEEITRLEPGKSMWRGGRGEPWNDW